MLTTRKRTILSAAQKREICEIKEREPNLSNVSLAQRYNIGKSTVTDILSEKERWLAISGDQGSIKKFRRPKWPQLEQALGLWVDNALNTRQDIDGNILKVKAAFFAERFSIEDFHQSEGWLTGFKKRHGLQQFKEQGEASSAPSVESIENDRLALQDFLKSYNQEDIWNADETGLFWKMEPSKVLARGPISGHKKKKSWVTIFCAVNATGTEKMALSFIHKHKTPRAMKNLNYKNLPVYYFWNKKSWMQVSIFNEILLKLNEKMRRKGRKIVLLVDNAPVHLILDETKEKLDSINVKFLPPNTTTALQPCDAEIIHSFKYHYKRLFIQNRIEAYDNVQDGFVEKLADYNILKLYRIQLKRGQWYQLKQSQIAGKTPKFYHQVMKLKMIQSLMIIIIHIIEDEEVELENLIAFLPEGDHLNAREYINIEDEIAEGALTDDEIIDAILNADKEEEIVVEENESMPIMEKVSLKEAEKAVNNITQFLYEQGSEFGDVNDELKILKGLHKRIKLLIVRNLKQLNLNNFCN
ncbi:Pdc2p [Rhizophagus irregularis DAOM 197198w]|uniref:Pdc2p n=1 Tax=Rhizophagus irregularis (strain DAOM 197198w) TaxID=1432141 RepID=A0A015L5X2_RHIIW|nr:Pdc2p [Rhizophagus irregularis DAOM 197198w]